MVPGASPESQWYVQIDDKTHGPFSWEEILRLYQSGQIRLEHKVTGPQFNGKWVALQEFAQAPASRSVPPRPDDLTSALGASHKSGPTHPTGTPSSSSAAYDLLDLLQVAKERNSKSSSAVDFTTTLRYEPEPRRLRLIAAISACLMVLVWAGVSRLRSMSSSPSEAPTAETKRDMASTEQAPKPPTIADSSLSSTRSFPASKSTLFKVSKPQTAASLLLGRPVAPPPTMDRGRDRDLQKDDRDRDQDRDRDREDRDRDYADRGRDDRDSYGDQRDEVAGTNRPSNIGVARGPAGADSNPASRPDVARQDDGVVHSANADEEDAQRAPANPSPFSNAPPNTVPPISPAGTPY